MPVSSQLKIVHSGRHGPQRLSQDIHFTSSLRHTPPHHAPTMLGRWSGPSWKPCSFNENFSSCILYPVFCTFQLHTNKKQKLLLQLTKHSEDRPATVNDYDDELGHWLSACYQRVHQLYNKWFSSSGVICRVWAAGGVRAEPMLFARRRQTERRREATGRISGRNEPERARTGRS